MRREIEYQWRIRELMARHRMRSSTDLIEPLSRGIPLADPRMGGWSRPPLVPG